MRQATLLLDWLDNPREERALHLAGPDGQWHHVPYPGLADDVYRVAALLRDAGVPRNGVVMLMLGEPLDFVAAFMAGLAIGATPLPVATPLTFRGRKHYVAHTGGIMSTAEPSVVLADDALAELAEEARSVTRSSCPVLRFSWENCLDADRSTRRYPADLALLQFTSGSTGHPKGVRVSWDNLAGNVSDIHHWLSWSDEDSVASWLPLYHDMGLIGALLTPLTAGSDLWLMLPDQFIRNPLRWIDCFGRKGATISTSPSFGYAYVARRLTPAQVADMDFSAWRLAILGAERIDPMAVAGFAALLGPRGFRSTSLAPAYGLAESTLAVSGVRPGTSSRVVRLEPGSAFDGEPVIISDTAVLGVDPVRGGGWVTGCGQPVRNTTVRIASDAGDILPDGHLGEIQVSGSSVAQGYVQAGPADQTFTPEGLATGDAGFMLDGEVFVIGRIGDSLKVRGAFLHAEEVEADVAALPGLGPGQVAAVFGTASGRDVAAVLIEDSSTAWLEDVVALLRSQTADQARIVILTSRRGAILRTSSGKPRRRVMWRQLMAGESSFRPAYTTWQEADGPCPWEPEKLLPDR
jgi:acyl-CoA synthetase (AMP-forming)/AMP-acid ligase II